LKVFQFLEQKSCKKATVEADVDTEEAAKVKKAPKAKKEDTQE